MWVDYRGPLSTVYNDGEISSRPKHTHTFPFTAHADVLYMTMQHTTEPSQDKLT